MRTRRSSRDEAEAEADTNPTVKATSSLNEDGEESSGGSSSSNSDDDDEAEEESDQDEGEGEGGGVSQEEIRHAVALASEAARKTFGWDAKKNDNGNGHGSTSSGSSKGKKGKSRFGGPGAGNALSDLIPGYTAPMRLEAPHYAQTQGKTNSKSREASHVVGSGALSHRAEAMRHRRPGAGGASSFKMGARSPADGTAGDGWFGMVPTAVTDSVRADVAILRNRTYLDPKRFYKKADAVDLRRVQVGTVIEGANEYYSHRLTQKERRQNLAEEVMADGDVARYAKRQFGKIQDQRQAARGQGYGRKKQRTGGRRGGRR